MARRIDVERELGIEDYEAVAHLAPAVLSLREQAARIVPRLRDRTVWMVNSTERGGGVAEMLPTLVTLLRDLGVRTEWVVLESDEEDFFALTKRIHNLIHGAGEAGFTDDDRALFERVNRENAKQMAPWVGPGDIMAVHDPQPMGLVSALRETVTGLPAIWRCHIGLDEKTPETRSAWEFLDPYTSDYQRGIFTAPEYVPDAFRTSAVILHPAINPLTHKNRELSVHKVIGVLANAALAIPPSPVLTPMYPDVAQRLQPTGEWAPANMAEDIGLPTRPIVSQVSRWDRLKGWRPLLDGFAHLKQQERHGGKRHSDIHRRRLELVRLVMAGPDPQSVADDPEGAQVLEELRQAYLELPPHIQRDVALVALPMRDPAQNALMVNAIQRASSVVVQNSLREGFGLTVTEAMWKRVPVLTNTQACGPRQQVRHQEHGWLTSDPSDPLELCTAMDEMLRRSEDRDTWGRNAQRRVHRNFLIFNQAASWLQVLEAVAPA